MHKEKIRKSFVIGFIILGLILWIYELNSPKDRIVEGVGEGFNGNIVAKLKIKTKGNTYKIVGLDIDHEDTPEIANPAIEKIKAHVLKEQNADFDSASGATYTSEGVEEAVKNAINKLNNDVELQ